MRRTTMFVCGAAIAALALTGCNSKESGSPLSGTSGGSGSSGSASSGSPNKAGFNSLKLLSDEVGKQSSAKQSTHVTMKITAAGADVTGDGDMNFGANPAMQLSMNAAGQQISMILVDKVLYMKLPGLSQGDKWLKLDTNSDDPLMKTLGSALDQAQTADPAKTLAQFAQAGEIKSSAQESLGGEQTTHYQIVVDVKKMADLQTDPTMKKALQDAAASGGLTTFPMDLWVNSDNLPVQVTMDMPIDNPQTGAVSSTKMQINYTDWGKPVSITAPPADQVMAMPR